MERTKPGGSSGRMNLSACSAPKESLPVTFCSGGRLRSVLAMNRRFVSNIRFRQDRHNFRMAVHLPGTHPQRVIVCCLITACMIAGCIGTYGMKEITDQPYPLISEDESIARFGLPDEDVFIEIRRAPISRSIENLAIHYAALFPGGEVIRPGDAEEYLKIGGRNAFKVHFRPKYIRKRKRIAENSTNPKDEVPEGWTRETIEDPVTGKPATVLQGPVIPRERILYLVAGESYVYYIFMRADGDSIEPARKKLEKLVREQIKYR